MSAPYRPGQVEHTRAQAEFWHAFMRDDPQYRLAPACAVCGASEEYLHFLPHDASYVCECGARTSATELRAGEIVPR